MPDSLKNMFSSVDWSKVMTSPDTRNALIGASLGGLLLGGAGLMSKRDPEESRFAPVGDALLGAVLGGVAGYGIPKGLALFNSPGSLAPDNDVVRYRGLGDALKWGGLTAGGVGLSTIPAWLRAYSRLRKRSDARIAEEFTRLRNSAAIATKAHSDAVGALGTARANQAGTAVNPSLQKAVNNAARSGSIRRKGLSGAAKIVADAEQLANNVANARQTVSGTRQALRMANARRDGAIATDGGLRKAMLDNFNKLDQRYKLLSKHKNPNVAAMAKSIRRTMWVSRLKDAIAPWSPKGIVEEFGKDVPKKPITFTYIKDGKPVTHTVQSTKLNRLANFFNGNNYKPKTVDSFIGRLSGGPARVTRGPFTRIARRAGKLGLAAALGRYLYNHISGPSSVDNFRN